jgi:hypothetical protein
MRMCVVAFANDSLTPSVDRAPDVAGAQRGGRVTTFVGHDRPDIPCQLRVTVLEAAALLPLSLKTGDVLGVAAVGPPPGLGHPGLRQAGVGPPAHGEPGYHLSGFGSATWTHRCRRTGSGQRLDRSAAIAAVLIDGHLPTFRSSASPLQTLDQT